MRKLALSDEILLSIEKPARYIGNEVNSVMKDKEQVDIRVAFCFPDVYEIGMSHLGIQILYDMFNRRDDIWCERVYSPWIDLDRVLREKHIPLFALESQDPIKDFDFLGITLQYEMCYTNILQILELSAFRWMPVSVARTVRLSLAAVRAHTIRSRSQNFLICSTSERARRSMIRCLIYIRNVSSPAHPARNFCAVLRIFRASMCRLSIR